jgi:hypothetical protein
MASCRTCGTTILFGGKQHGELRFCNDICLDKGQVLVTAEALDPAQVSAAAMEVHRGLCPRCGGSGPVDIHTSYEVWSLLLVTSWKSVPQVSCRSCGVRHQLGGLFFSFFLGWWGFPWGILMTPVQVLRNVGGLFSPPAPEQPSRLLGEHVRMFLAEGAQAEDR